MICGQIYGFSFTSVSLYLMIFAHIKTKNGKQKRIQMQVLGPYTLYKRFIIVLIFRHIDAYFFSFPLI